MKISVLKPFLVGIATCVAGSGFVACTTASSNKPKLADLKADANPAEKAFHAGLKAGYDDDWATSIGFFREAMRLDPDHRQAQVNVGVALERNGDLKGASDVYREVFERDTQNLNAASNYTRTLMAVGEFMTASQVIKQALAVDPESPVLLNTYSGVLRQLKEYDRAANTARQVLLRDQKNAAAIKNLALIYADQKKFQLAETFFRNAMKLDDKDVSILVNLGLIAYQRGDHQRAIGEFEKALKLDPNNAVALANMGSIRLQFRDYVRAEKAYKSAIAAGMVNCTTVAALGYAYEGMPDRSKEAISQLGEAYKQCPKQTDILRSMGQICLVKMRDQECALKYLTEFTQAAKGLTKEHPVFQQIEFIKESIEAESAGPERLPEETNSESTADSGEGVGSEEAEPAPLDTQEEGTPSPAAQSRG